MKSMMRKTTLREIRQTFGRFAAILAITALGVGFFSGVRVTTPAMVNMMNAMFQQQQFYDYRLLSTVGWDAENVDALAAEDGVRYAEGSITLDALYTTPTGESVVLKTHLLPQKINQLILKSGRLPETAGECVADAKTAFRIGDVLTVDNSNDDSTKEKLTKTSYTVVGLVNSPSYINFERGSTALGNGSVAGFVYLHPDAFDMDYFTELYVRFDRNAPIYSDSYKHFMDGQKDAWEKHGSQQAHNRTERIRRDGAEEIRKGRAELEEKRIEGQQELDDAKKKLDDAETQLADAKLELDDAAAELENGKPELDAAKKKIEDGKKELQKVKKQLDDSKKTLDDTDKQLTDGEKQLKDGQAQLDDARAQLKTAERELRWQWDMFKAKENAFYDDYGSALVIIDLLPYEQQKQLRDGLAQLEDGKKKLQQADAELEAGKQQLNTQQATLDETRKTLNDGRTAYRDGLAQYQDGLKQYHDAKEELDEGEKTYLDSLKQYEDGLQKYNDGRKEYENGLKELQDGKADYEQGCIEFREKIADAEQELADAEQKLADIEEADVYLLDRNTNIGYACFESDSEIVAQVAKVFPIFFILVAALVCMTTMSRMVEEQRTQLGMLKALGYSEGAIMAKFICYAGSAAMIGCVLGFALGTVLFPAIIWMTYKLMYIPLSIPYLFDWKLAVASVLASLVCSVGVTWFSCRFALTEAAANLMRPKAPKAGKRVLLERIPFLWNHMKFLYKVSVRNIFRYKGRFFMMVIGIGGCMALLLTGFGIKDSIAGFADTQYEEVQIADASVSYQSDDAETVRTLLQHEAKESLIMHTAAWDLLYEDRQKSVNLQVVEQFDTIDAFMQFRDMDGVPLNPPALNEALISHSIANRYGANVGDTITLRDADMQELHLTVAGIFENHVYHYVFLSAETYQAQLATAPEWNSAYVNFDEDADLSTAAASLSGEKCIANLTLFRDIKVRMANMMQSLDYIVILVIICAAGLAFVVIYNLTNINITERTREIATIKVLGFFRNETSAYVLRENLALTAIGATVGLGLGILLHRFVMAQIVVDLVDFTARILPQSYLYSIILTFVFNFVVNLFMERKLEHINMAESLKSVD